MSMQALYDWLQDGQVDNLCFHKALKDAGYNTAELRKLVCHGYVRRDGVRLCKVSRPVRVYHGGKIHEEETARSAAFGALSREWTATPDVVARTGYCPAMVHMALNALLLEGRVEMRHEHARGHLRYWRLKP